MQEKFKTGLLNSAEDFKKNVGALAEEFDTNGPFSDATPISEALSYISSIREQLGTLKTEEDSLRRGLGIFKIDHPSSHSLQAMDKVRIHECAYMQGSLSHTYTRQYCYVCIPALAGGEGRRGRGDEVEGGGRREGGRECDLMWPVAAHTFL